MKATLQHGHCVPGLGSVHREGSWGYHLGLLRGSSTLCNLHLCLLVQESAPHLFLIYCSSADSPKLVVTGIRSLPMLYRGQTKAQRFDVVDTAHHLPPLPDSDINHSWDFLVAGAVPTRSKRLPVPSRACNKDTPGKKEITRLA